MSFELKQTIRLIKSVQAEIVVLDKQIKLVVVELDSPLITIPGISYTLAAIILAEIGDINRFFSPAKLLAFAGLEPSTYQSGNFTASNTPMVKCGSTYLRWAIMTSARLVSMRDTLSMITYPKNVQRASTITLHCPMSAESFFVLFITCFCLVLHLFLNCNL